LPGWWKESYRAIVAGDAHLRANPKLILEGLIQSKALPSNILPEMHILHLQDPHSPTNATPGPANQPFTHTEPPEEVDMDLQPAHR
jgi:hypothetical protein